MRRKRKQFGRRRFAENKLLVIGSVAYREEQRRLWPRAIPRGQPLFFEKAFEAGSGFFVLCLSLIKDRPFLSFDKAGEGISPGEPNIQIKKKGGLKPWTTRKKKKKNYFGKLTEFFMVTDTKKVKPTVFLQSKKEKQFSE